MAQCGTHPLTFLLASDTLHREATSGIPPPLKEGGGKEHHLHWIHPDTLPSSPLGKLQELVQLFRGVDITQGVLGVNEDEASDLHALKPAENRTFSVLPEGKDGQATR